MSPAPGAFTFFTRRERQTRLVVGAARVARGTGSPGTVLVASNGRLVVAAGRQAGQDALGALKLTELKPEGKRMISAPEFLRGYRIAAGSVFA
jgi:methionyl-tRNA formyltransferase